MNFRMFTSSGLQVRVVGWGVLMWTCAAFAGPCSSQGQQPTNDFQLLGSGDQILDRRTQLIWARCVDEQVWTHQGCAQADLNRPVQTAKKTFSDALRWAQHQSRDDMAWRLPSWRELTGFLQSACADTQWAAMLSLDRSDDSDESYFWTTTRLEVGRAVVNRLGTRSFGARVDESSLQHLRLVREP